MTMPYVTAQQHQKKYSPKEEAQWTAESVHKALDLVYSLPLNP